MERFDKANFNGLLAWFDPDRERAAERYELIRRRLIAFFHTQGCGTAAEELADRTLDVVARKLAAETKIHVKPEHYCYGVARKVRLEYSHRPAEVQLPFDLASEVAPAIEDDLTLLACLIRCLQRLSPLERDFINRFYDGRGQARVMTRKRMAEEAGISRNALGIRAFGLRRRLERDVRECLHTWTAPVSIAETRPAARRVTWPQRSGEIESPRPPGLERTPSAPAPSEANGRSGV